MPLIAALADLPAAASAVLMLRHAEREAIIDRESGWHAALTDAGRASAVELGRRLASWSPVAIDHSPIPRCGATAASLAEGLLAGGCALPPGRDLEVFSGPFIYDLDPVLDTYLGLGNGSFLRAWFDGELAPEIIQPASAAAADQLAGLGDLLPERGPHLGLVISHDWNIALVRECLLAQRHEDVGLPAVLDGLLCWREGAGLALRSGDRQVHISVNRLRELRQGAA